MRLMPQVSHLIIKLWIEGEIIQKMRVGTFNGVLHNEETARKRSKKNDQVFLFCVSFLE
jgi:hypothetical protein